jgi:hypothetical protein
MLKVECDYREGVVRINDVDSRAASKELADMCNYAGDQELWMYAMKNKMEAAMLGSQKVFADMCVDEAMGELKRRGYEGLS